MSNTRHLSVVIAREPEAVYAFARDVENLPRWAAGLATAEVHPGDRDGELVAESPMGTVTFASAPDNPFGVLDHDVTLPDGAVVHNPLRVLAHPDGAEVGFTLRRLAMNDEEFDRDTAMVEANLERLKGLLEAP